MRSSLKILGLAAVAAFGFMSAAYADEPYLGVYLIDETENKDGAVIEGVKGDSPAGKAGLKKGDLIVAFNGKKTPNGKALIEAITSASPGATVEMIASRDGWQRKMSLTLGRSNPEAESETPAAKPDPAPSGGSGFLGVYLAPGEGEGAHVDGTVRGSPARKAGLKKGDVITSINGKSVGNEQDLIAVLGQSRVGAKVDLVVRREGWDKRVSITLGVRSEEPPASPEQPEAPEQPSAEGKSGYLGIAIEESNGKVVVDEVEAGSPAEKGAMKKGDVIVSVNGSPVASGSDLGGVLSKCSAGDTVTMVIERGGWKRTIKITLGTRP